MMERKMTIANKTGREEITERVQQIMDSNYKRFKGMNEAELHIREEIADLFENQVNPFKSYEFWQILANRLHKTNMVKDYVEPKNIFDWFLKECNSCINSFKASLSRESILNDISLKNHGKYFNQLTTIEERAIILQQGMDKLIDSINSK